MPTTAHMFALAPEHGRTLAVDLASRRALAESADVVIAEADPRPIEGIVHATYVLARVNHALVRIREHTELSPAEQAAIDAKIARNAANYEAGRETVRAHARFTPDGAAIFTACQEAMAGDR